MRIGDSWKCGVTIPKLLNQFVIKSANSKQGGLRSFVRIAFVDFPNPFVVIGFDRDHAISRNYLHEAGMSQSGIEMGSPPTGALAAVAIDSILLQLCETAW